MVSLLRSKTFLSVLFGSFISIVYIFVVYVLSGELEYSGFKDFFIQLLPSILPLWFICFFFVFCVYKLLNPVFDNWNKRVGFNVKAKYGIPIFCYLIIVILAVLIGKFTGVGMFNLFMVSSSLGVGGIFSASMADALSSLDRVSKGSV